MIRVTGVFLPLAVMAPPTKSLTEFLWDAARFNALRWDSCRWAPAIPSFAISQKVGGASAAIQQRLHRSRGAGPCQNAPEGIAGAQRSEPQPNALNQPASPHKYGKAVA